MKTIPERTFLVVTAEPRDQDETLFTPTAARYRIDCLTSKTQIADWTTIVSPSTSNAITVTAEQNRIIDASHSIEVRELVFAATDPSTTEEVKGIKRWRVENLQGVTSS